MGAHFGRGRVPIAAQDRRDDRAAMRAALDEADGGKLVDRFTHRHARDTAPIRPCGVAAIGVCEPPRQKIDFSGVERTSEPMGMAMAEERTETPSPHAGEAVLKVAIAGFGAIGKAVARKLAAGAIPRVALVAVASRDESKAARALAEAGIDVPVRPIESLSRFADVVIECAPAAVLDRIARPVLTAGKKVIVVSVGALLRQPDLIELARRHGGQIIVPSGALLGLDAVSAAAEGKIHSVRMVTRKPIAGLSGAPYLEEHKIDISGLREPMRVFEGTAREAALGFPANLNVAVALSLAGIGPDETRIEIWADPAINRNIHRILLDSDAAKLDMTIENIPSENPKTGRMAALSVLSTLRKLQAELRVGS